MNKASHLARKEIFAGQNYVVIWNNEICSGYYRLEKYQIWNNGTYSRIRYQLDKLGNVFSVKEVLINNVKRGSTVCSWYVVSSSSWSINLRLVATCATVQWVSWEKRACHSNDAVLCQTLHSQALTFQLFHSFPFGRNLRRWCIK